MTKDYLLKSLQRLARPLVGLCLRNGIKLGELIDALKRVYVHCAQDILIEGESEVSTSRITLMTGVHRTDVAEIRAEKSFSPKEHHTASDVITQWRYDARYAIRPGRPRPLAFEGKESEFAELVRSVSLSVSPYTVLFELERLGIVKKTSDGKLKLLSRVFVPKGDPEAVLEMLAEDAEDLFIAVEENAFTPAGTPVKNHHLKTEYRNIPDQSLPEVRDWLMREGSAFHERARNFLAKHDRDLNTTLKGSGSSRIAVASFSRISPVLLSKKERSKK